MDKILVVVCARKGSKGLKSKNVRSLLGKPLICHTIEQAVGWRKAKYVVVSTDSTEIADIAKKAGALVPFVRPRKLATDKASKVEALRHAVMQSERIFKQRFNIIVDLDVTAPFRTIYDLNRCLSIFKKKKVKTLFSVVKAHKNPYFNMVERKPGGNTERCIKPKSNFFRRQDAPSVYSMNASIYFYDRDYLVKSDWPSPFSDKTEIYVMKDIAGFDIDSEADFKFVEFLAREGLIHLSSGGTQNYLNRYLLRDKIAFVAGGTGLIGTEVCRALADAGAKTTILDINRKRGLQLEQELIAKGQLSEYVPFDITKLKNMENSLSRLMSRFGGCDIWVNAAYPRTKDWNRNLEEISVESLRKNIDMQLNSSIWASRVIACLMKKRKIKGCIINFSSIYGLQASDFTVYEGTNMTSPMAYAAIKSGIINTTRYLASYFGKFGIRVNSICPGGILDGQEKRFIQNYENKVPLRRMGKPDEIAAAVLFLATNASSYVTGSTLTVDGGWTIV